ncbi:hypothetical protein D3C87_2087930 [compost metagenome]
MHSRIDRHALQRGQYTGVEGAVCAILPGKVSSQCLLRFVDASLRDNPLMQLPDIGEVMQR